MTAADTFDHVYQVSLVTIPLVMSGLGLVLSLLAMPALFVCLVYNICLIVWRLGPLGAAWIGAVRNTNFVVLLVDFAMNALPFVTRRWAVVDLNPRNQQAVF